MAKRNTYIANFLNHLLNPGLNISPVCSINNACRRMFLTSILFDLMIEDVTAAIAAQNVPIEVNHDLTYGIRIGTIAAAIPISNIMVPIAAPAPDPAARDIMIHQVGQYFFNDIRFDNIIVVSLVVVNNSNVNIYNVHANITIETTE